MWRQHQSHSPTTTRRCVGTSGDDVHGIPLTGPCLPGTSHQLGAGLPRYRRRQNPSAGRHAVCGSSARTDARGPRCGLRSVAWERRETASAAGRVALRTLPKAQTSTSPRASCLGALLPTRLLLHKVSGLTGNRDLSSCSPPCRWSPAGATARGPGAEVPLLLGAWPWRTRTGPRSASALLLCSLSGLRRPGQIAACRRRHWRRSSAVRCAHRPARRPGRFRRVYVAVLGAAGRARCAPARPCSGRSPRKRSAPARRPHTPFRRRAAGAAHELHDVVGHTLVAINVQAAAARAARARGGATDGTARSTEITSASPRPLAELRTTLKALRSRRTVRPRCTGPGPGG